MNDRDFDRLLSDVSRSFYLSLRIVPAVVREPLSLGYALARLSDTIADSSDAPSDERIRALRELPDRWVDRWTAPDPGEARLLKHGKDLLDRLTHSAWRREIEDVWATIRNGQIFDVERFPSPVPLSESELQTYTYSVAGCVGEFWTRICFAAVRNYADAPVETMLRLGRSFGDALQLVNILRDRVSDGLAGRVYVPAERLQETIAVARTGLQAGVDYAAGVRSSRLRLAVLLPARLGLRTLELIEAAPDARRVKVPRRELWAILMMALPGLLPGRFSRLVCL
ncbi:MAG: squalene/phytoene synthase family protein [Terrimicrobiaceae bacterium]|nr:squalene/phytoene synthase family protein [Terrimicrobiaceae bacterium]